MQETRHMAAFSAGVFLLTVLGVSSTIPMSPSEQQGALSAAVIERVSPDIHMQHSAGDGHEVTLSPNASDAAPVHEVSQDVAGEVAAAALTTATIPEQHVVVDDRAHASKEPRIGHVIATMQDTETETVTNVPSLAADIAAAIHQATNDMRHHNGVPALMYDATLAANAEGYSASMQKTGQLSHTDPSGCSMTCRFNKAGYVAEAWGENLAVWKSSDEPSVAEVVDYVMRAWGKSDGHRDNLLSRDFTHQGVGVVRAGNTIYVTVHFAKP